MKKENTTSKARKSVLDDQQLAGGKTSINYKNLKIVSWIFFLLMFIGAYIKDANVLMLSIPEFENLEIHEGLISFTKRGNRKRFLTINNDKQSMNFTCWITSAGISDCIDKQQRKVFTGKKAKVYSYKGIIDGLFWEDRLMQLEVDGLTVISYDEQYKRYNRYKENHPFILTVIAVISFLWLVLLYTLLYLKDQRGQVQLKPTIFHEQNSR